MQRIRQGSYQVTYILESAGPGRLTVTGEVWHEGISIHTFLYTFSVSQGTEGVIASERLDKQSFVLTRALRRWIERTRRYNEWEPVRLLSLLVKKTILEDIQEW